MPRLKPEKGQEKEWVDFINKGRGDGKGWKKLAEDLEGQSVLPHVGYNAVYNICRRLGLDMKKNMNCNHCCKKHCPPYDRYVVMI